MITVHVAWAMVFIGFTPFLWQCFGGTWDAAQLGCWPNYAPFSPLGAMILCETAPVVYFRPALLTMASFSLVISVTVIVARGTALVHMYQSEADVLWDAGSDVWLQTYNLENSAPAANSDTADTALRISLFCFWLGAVVLNFCLGVDLLAGFARNIPLYRMHAKAMFWCRTTTCVCGLLLSAVVVSHQRPHFALEGYVMGSTATALTWTLVGLSFSPQVRVSWMRDVSNGLSATQLP